MNDALLPKRFKTITEYYNEVKDQSVKSMTNILTIQLNANTTGIVKNVFLYEIGRYQAINSKSEFIIAFTKYLD